MKKGTIALLVVLGLIVLIAFNGCNTFNSLGKKDEAVTGQWKNVEVAYQARMDKTKNLFEIAQSGAEYEKSTLTAVIEARSKATSIKVDASNLTEEKLAEFQKAQDAFGSSLGRLMAISESYPQLMAVQSFRDLQTQYEGMENRIATERRRFNEMAQDYNTQIRMFPRNIWAGIFGFQKRAYFSASAGAEDAPDIKGMKAKQ